MWVQRGDRSEDEIIDIEQDELPDVAVFQRPQKSVSLDLIRALQKRGVAVVVEVDDDFTCIDWMNAAYCQVHPRWFRRGELEKLKDKGVPFRVKQERQMPNGMYYWTEDVRSCFDASNIVEACRIADLVTVSTPALAKRYGGHGRVRVLPNYIPKRYLTLRHQSEYLRLGWPGSTQTHGGDLEVAGTAVRDVVDQTGITFIAMGGGATRKQLDVPGMFLPWVPTEYGYASMVSALNVGIAPLVDNAFNRAKSWLKGLEYAALGVAYVASPLPEYQRLNNMGAGALAARPREWTRELRRLITDASYRAEQVQRNEAVAREMTIEAHAWRWLEAWEDARVNRIMAKVAA